MEKSNNLIATKIIRHFWSPNIIFAGCKRYHQIVGCNRKELPDDEFECEPDVTDELNIEERFMWVCLSLV